VARTRERNSIHDDLIRALDEKRFIESVCKRSGRGSRRRTTTTEEKRIQPPTTRKHEKRKHEKAMRFGFVLSGFVFS